MNAATPTPTPTPAPRRALLPPLALLALLALGASPGERAPALETTGTRGERMSLSSLRGRVVVVDFFASWCEPCRRSLPALDALSRRYESRGLTVLGVSVDDEEQQCRRFVQSMHPSFASACDANHAIAARWSPDAMPTSYLIDRSGTVIARYPGYPPENGASLERDVEALLGRSP